jgi:hypothetical protein
MIDFDVLVIGLIAFVLGLIGTVIRSSNEEHRKKSYTDVQFTWSIYILLGVGVVLILWAFF